MRNLKPEQQDTGTRLATPFADVPFPRVEGNRRRLHAGYCLSIVDKSLVVKGAQIEKMEASDWSRAGGIGLVERFS